MSSEQCDKATDCCSHSIFIRNGWKAEKELLMMTGPIQLVM